MPYFGDPIHELKTGNARIT